MRKNIRKRYRDSELKMIVPTRNDDFELPNGSYSVSDNHDYNKYIIKKEILTKIAPIHNYINRINNRVVFKVKDPETIKLFDSKKNLIPQLKLGKFCIVLK